MWIFTLSDGTKVTGNREEIAEWFNFFDDVYDDEVWDEFCDDSKVQWISDFDNTDNTETIDYDKVYDYLNKLNLKYEGKEIYFGTTKELCRDHNMSIDKYYFEFSRNIIKLPKY